MATALMRQHGLHDWQLVWDRAKTRAGVCRPGARQIGLSRVLTELHSEAEVRDTVLHEIAHALVGVQHGHDAVWRATARAIGCSATRTITTSAPKPPAPWVGTCPAGHVSTRHRRPERVRSCAKCSPTFDPAALVTWTFHGRTVPMPPRYVAELRAVQELTIDGVPGAAAARAAGAQDGEAGPKTVAALGRLPVGARVRVLGGGRYAGVTGSILKRGRTRYHVRIAAGVLTVPFGLAERI
jgi:predicted SprT family Zn-dependent metalloprotease